MTTVSLAEAKAQLSRLIDLAQSGEAICITRRGKPVAQITAARAPRKKVDVAALARLTETMTPESESAGTFVRKMRDAERY
ncbi:MAG: type II toxin-antitoxin system Phd/YefM family antitoxin [Caulobacteraceae bacterium]